MESVFIATAIVALNEFVKRVRAKDYEGIVTIVSAVLIGVLAGVLHIEGLNVLNGVYIALAAVGIHTVAKQVG